MNRSGDESGGVSNGLVLYIYRRIFRSAFSVSREQEILLGAIILR